MSYVTVYDSGALTALDDKRNFDAALDHNRRVDRGESILVPSVVAAQVIRNPPKQARLMRALKGCDIVPFSRVHHVPVGTLLAAAGTSDIVDGFVALLAAQTADLLVTSDVDDIGRLLDVLGAEVAISRA
jgi:predicted nucleic acid-binding protein